MKKIEISMTRTEVVLGWVYFIFQLLFLGAILVVLNVFLPKPMTMAELNILMFVLNFIFIILIFHKFLWKNLLVLGKSILPVLKISGIGFMLYYGSSILVNLLVYAIMPEFANANDSNVTQMLQENYTLMALCTVLLVPVVEETLYRGLIFRSLYNRFPLLGYIVSATLFAAIHVIGYIGTWDSTMLCLAFLQYLPAGIFLGWAYVKSGSIWASIIIHITVNQIAILASR